VTHETAEEAGITPAFPVADDDVLPLGGDIEDLEVDVHPLVKLTPDRLDLIETAISQNTVNPRIGGKKLAQRRHVEAVERLDIGPSRVACLLPYP
jgi:hypothetical protein